MVIHILSHWFYTNECLQIRNEWATWLPDTLESSQRPKFVTNWRVLLNQRENKALLFVASSFKFTLGGIVAFESCILSVTMGLLRAPLGTATGRILWRRVKIMHFLEWRELEKRKRPLYFAVSKAFPNNSVWLRTAPLGGNFLSLICIPGGAHKGEQLRAHPIY